MAPIFIKRYGSVEDKETTWENISKWSKAGTLKKYIDIGFEKEIKFKNSSLGTDRNYTLQFADYKEETVLYEGTRKTATFISKELINTNGFTISTGSFYMESNNPLSILMENVKSILPDDLSSVIVQVVKKSLNGYGVVSSKLKYNYGGYYRGVFVPSLSEIFDSSFIDNSSSEYVKTLGNEGNRFEIFQSGIDDGFKKPSGSTSSSYSDYYTRTPGNNGLTTSNYTTFKPKYWWYAPGSYDNGLPAEKNGYYRTAPFCVTI